jgi:hypothetical protein
MKMNLVKSGVLAAAVCAAVLSSGCHTPQPSVPVKSGFLSSYNNLVQVDATTWRYLDTQRLPRYTSFQIRSVKVLFDEFDGKPLTAEQREKVTNYLREAITKALTPAYPIVTAPGFNVGQIDVAITKAAKEGGRLELWVEGEILDSYTRVQVAAVMKSELGKNYLGDWWDRVSAKEMMDGWAEQLRKTIDAAHGK